MQYATEKTFALYLSIFSAIGIRLSRGGGALVDRDEPKSSGAPIDMRPDPSLGLRMPATLSFILAGKPAKPYEGFSKRNGCLSGVCD